MEAINEFAKLNKMTDRKIYKEEWNKWMNANEKMVNEEIERMNTLGYNECVKDKMFKAGRYYFRKKNIRECDVADADMTADVANATTTKQRQYIKLSDEILQMMDNHIKQNINDDDEFTPAKGHKQFCSNNTERLDKERIDIEMNSSDAFHEKIKKTYKNRYFIITRT